MIPTVKVRGLEQLKKELQRLSNAAQTRLAKNASMAMARVVARHARNNAPFVTGELRRGIKARRDPNRKGAPIALANSKVWYSHLVEFGTVHSAAKPFLRPALDEHRAEVEAKAAANLSRGIEREVRKQQIAEDQGET